MNIPKNTAANRLGPSAAPSTSTAVIKSDLHVHKITAPINNQQQADLDRPKNKTLITFQRIFKTCPRWALRPVVSLCVMLEAFWDMGGYSSHHHNKLKGLKSVPGSNFFSLVISADAKDRIKATKWVTPGETAAEFDKHYADMEKCAYGEKDLSEIPVSIPRQRTAAIAAMRHTAGVMQSCLKTGTLPLRSALLIRKLAAHVSGSFDPKAQIIFLQKAVSQLDESCVDRRYGCYFYRGMIINPTPGSTEEVENTRGEVRYSIRQIRDLCTNLLFFLHDKEFLEFMNSIPLNYTGPIGKFSNIFSNIDKMSER